MAEKKLTPKQDRFCREYVIDCNGTQAAIRAGYSPKTANEQASRLLANVSVSRRVHELQGKVAEKCEITAEYVLNGLREVAERCMEAKPVLDREGHETGEFTFNPSGANKAFELLGKYLKLFTDKHETEGRVTLAQALSDLDRLEDTETDAE